MSPRGIKTDLEREKAHIAQQMLTAFFVLAKTARVYETNNDSYRGQLTRFHNLFKQYIEDNYSCTIKLVSGRLFVDDQFVKIDGDDRIGIGPMLARWEELGIGGMIFGDSLAADETTGLLHLLSSFTAGRGEPCEKFNDQLDQEGIDSISVFKPEINDTDHLVEMEDRQRLRKEARQTFFRAVSVVKDVIRKTQQKEAISVARTRRVIHTIIDQISENESALLELASIKNFDDYTYAHSVNVSIYSLALGFRLGLNRMELSELGFAALFHDIGKMELPHELITKKGRFDEFDWSQMYNHPLLGAMTVADTLKLDSHAARAMAVAFEHHIHPDFSGYPRLMEKRPINLYSRIVSITDSFDALTSGRVYIKEPIPADEVLRKLMYQMKVKFDPFLLKMFVNIIGIYPVGSLVLLSDKSLGIVTRVNRVEPTRPEIRLIADIGGPLDPPQWCDLADPGTRAIEILRIIDPEEYGIDTASYILSD